MKHGQAETNPQPTTSAAEQSKPSLYQTLWRWHLYAGLVFAPFLLILAVTGAVYLFKPQIEQSIYHHLYIVEAQQDKWTATRQVEAVLQQYPGATVTKYRPGEHATRSAEVKINWNGEPITVFVNPYTGELIGTLHDDERIMDKIEEFHGELMMGTVGDRIVELAACWSIILVVTGIYLWFPRGKGKLFGVLLPRLHRGRKTALRDLHAVPAFWVSAGMVFLVITGLLWSGLWGNFVQKLSTNAGVGYPPSIWVGSAPSSTLKTKEIAEVPWAAENLDVPASTPQGYVPVSIDDVMSVADRLGIYPTYEVFYPKHETGVYTISVFPPKARDEATVHIDQYTGAVLADYRYEHYEPIGKIMAWGITVHKGWEYGWPNLIVSLLVCIGIAGIVVSGFLMWWRRKPDGQMGAPKALPMKKQKGFLALMVAFGILFPLVGVSLIVVYLFDRLVVQRVPVLKRILNA